MTIKYNEHTFDVKDGIIGVLENDDTPSSIKLRTDTFLKIVEAADLMTKHVISNGHIYTNQDNMNIYIDCMIVNGDEPVIKISILDPKTKDIFTIFTRINKYSEFSTIIHAAYQLV